MSYQIPTTTPDLLSNLYEEGGIYYDRKGVLSTPTYPQAIPKMSYVLDPSTGNLASTGWTFEPAQWQGPFGANWWPWLNPFSFATADTANKILALFGPVATQTSDTAIRHATGYQAVIDDDGHIVGPFTRTVERLLVVSYGDKFQNYSCGLLACNVIRRGALPAMQSWAYELRVAGFTGVTVPTSIL